MNPIGVAKRVRKHNAKVRKAAKKRFRNYLDRIAKIRVAEQEDQRNKYHEYGQ